jgi:hypothetical protein
LPVGKPERTAIFMLRSNVRFFASRLGFATLDSRLKAASLIYDQVVLEEGIYDCQVGEGGAFQTVRQLMEPEDLLPVRNRPGAPFGVSMAPTGSTDFRTVLSATTEQVFRSQFHSFASEAHQAKADWIYWWTQDGSPSKADEVDKRLREWNWSESEFVKSLFPGKSRRLAELINANLNRDLAWSSALSADLAPDGLHGPLLSQKAGSRPEHARREGAAIHVLQLVLPEIRQASWSDIRSLRRDKGLTNLRAKLRELSADEVNDGEVQRRLIDEYEQELERRRPRWHREGVVAAVNFALGFIPGVSGLASASSAIQSAVDTGRSDYSWHATLFRLRRRLASRLGRAKPQTGDKIHQ